MSVTFRNANKSYKGKNRNGKKPVVQYREQKGNWLYSHFQKIYNRVYKINKISSNAATNQE